jgi:hypothetical protein
VDQRKEIEKSVRDVMKDLAHDPTINPLTVTEKDLRKKGLSPDEISELLKLKHIYIELESDKPVDPKLLGAELEDVMEDIRKSAEHTKADNEAHKGDDYTRKMHDADKLRDEVLHIDITKKDLGADQRAHIEKSVRDIMAGIGHDANINPETITEKGLKAKGLSRDEINELLKLKHIYIELESDGPVDPKLLAVELEDVMFDIRKSAEQSRVDKEAHNGDDYTIKMHDADILRDEVLHLDVGLKDIPLGQREGIEKSVRDVMADIAHDPKINPLTVTEEGLKARGLSPDEISELLKLKHIYKELDSDKPIDVRLLAAELDNVIDDIRKSAEHTKEAHDADDFTLKMHDADKLRDEMIDINLNLPDISLTQREHIEKSVRDVMADIAHDPKINPMTVTEEGLKARNLSPLEISEILKLKHIYKELDSNTPINPKLLAEELGGVIDDIRKSAEHTKADQEAHKGDDYTIKMHDADKLGDEILHINVN